MNDLMMIGEFSEATGVSKRMLRHYDKLGLINPEAINEDNGYRYYSRNQMTTIRTITLLQGYGFTLNEILELRQEEMTLSCFLESLKSKQLSLRNAIDEDTGHLINITRTIQSLSSKNLPGHGDTINLDQLTLERSQPMTIQPQIHPLQALKAEMLSLPDHNLFLEIIEEQVAAAPDQLRSLSTFDLDAFAKVNDNYGYTVGDLVIYQTYNILKQVYQTHIESGQAQICRMGGDEFALYMEGMTKEATIALAETVIEVTSGFDFGGLGCHNKMTNSCGIYFFKTAQHLQEPRHKSGMAFMEAKAKGGNQVVVHNQ